MNYLQLPEYLTREREDSEGLHGFYENEEYIARFDKGELVYAKNKSTQEVYTKWTTSDYNIIILSERQPKKSSLDIKTNYLKSNRRSRN